MEGTNYLTSGDLALWENRRDYGYGGYGYNHRGHSAASTTGIGLAAGLGGGAIFLAIAGLWGLNKASEARNQGQLALSAANTAAIGGLFTTMQQERNSREAWQSANMPSVQSYIDISNNNTAQSGALSNAAALAAAIAGNNGLNPAIGTESFLRVQRYSAPQPCGCDTCGN